MPAKQAPTGAHPNCNCDQLGIACREWRALPIEGRLYVIDRLCAFTAQMVGVPGRVGIAAKVNATMAAVRLLTHTPHGGDMYSFPGHMWGEAMKDWLAEDATVRELVHAHCANIQGVLQEALTMAKKGSKEVGVWVAPGITAAKCAMRILDEYPCLQDSVDSAALPTPSSEVN